MNKYQNAIEVIDTLLHLMCGEEREDGYKPTMEEMSKSMDLLKELVDKETATTPDIEGDGYYKGELVYDTWICPRCGTRYEIDYDEYEYCPKCGQHIDLDSLEQECEDTEDEE